MFISRIVVRNFRNFELLDVTLREGVTCVIGENNTGKTNLLHALRLAIDANFSSTNRQLVEHDIHHGVSLAMANQVVVSVEFTDYGNDVGENALVGCCEVEDNLARISYRFRPVTAIRELIEAEEHSGEKLSLSEDYHWEISGGGENDPATVEWNDDLGSQIRFQDLQNFQVEFLPALRDVQQSLRQSHTSPLNRLLSASEISDEEKNSLVEILRDANREIEKQPTIRKTGGEIDEGFADAVGEAFQMDLRLGIADPSFTSISRSLTILLSNSAIADFEPARNGLGLNNILYISMLLDYFKKRISKKKGAGQLLLIEEPEAHLHPQLQRVLYATLAKNGFQSIVTTHSTHISSHAPVESYVVLSNNGSGATASCVPTVAAKLSPQESADLSRFLDATRSTLLYARKVMLVEGPAELFLIPALVKQLMKIDLDRYGITVVPIYGTHFGLYAKLFGEDVLPKKCAIVCDGDLDPDALSPGVEEDSLLEDHLLGDVENDFVKVFQCPVTLERAVTINGTLKMMELTAKECSYPGAEQSLRIARSNTKDVMLKAERIKKARKKVLNAAKDCGKARFAQVASRYASEAKRLPAYIRAAVKWLIEDDNETDA